MSTPRRISAGMPAAVFAGLGARAAVFAGRGHRRAGRGEARPGDQVLVMSNGGFGGIHERLLATLDADH